MKRTVLAVAVLGCLSFGAIAAPSHYITVPLQSFAEGSGGGSGGGSGSEGGVKPIDPSDPWPEGIHPDKEAPEREEDGWWKSPVTGIVYCKGVPAGDTFTFSGDPIEYIVIADGDKLGAANNVARACTSNMTNMSSMPWPDSDNFNESLSHWDVSNVLDMYAMFSGALSFNQPLNNWDTSSNRITDSMFYYAVSFNQPLNNWDTSQVVDMNNMFAYSHVFNGDISSWDVSNSEYINNMFYEAFDFNQDISGWTLAYEADLTQMFMHARSFNQDISKWNMGDIGYVRAMFYGASSFNQDIGSWDVSNIVNMHGMFMDAVSFDQDLSGWCVSQFPDKPYREGIGWEESFDGNTPAWNKEGRQPVWGTCPSAP